MWHLPILGIAHASPALAGGFLTMEPPGHIWDSSFPHTYLVKEARIKRHGSWESSATALVCYPKLWGLWWAAQLPWDCFLPSEMPCFWTVAHQAPLSLGFLRPEYCRWCHFLLCCCCHVASVVPDSARPHRQQPTRLLCPWDSPGKNTGVGCHVLLQYMKVKSESEVTQWSRVRLLVTPGLQPTRLLCPWDSPGNGTGAGCHCLVWFPSLQESVLKLFSPGYCFWWRKGVPFQGLRVSSCLTLGNELSEERSAVQARGFIGKGCRGGGQEGEGNGENHSVTWLALSGFMVIGFISGLSLARHSELGSFLGAHASLSRDGFQRSASWEVGRTSELEPPISWPLQNSGWW